jgi:hypothetical protein
MFVNSIIFIAWNYRPVRGALGESPMSVCYHIGETGIHGESEVGMSE